MMYRVVLFFTVLTYCASAPINGPIQQRPNIDRPEDFSDYVDDGRSGYAFFRQQQVEGRPITHPLSTMSDEDLEDYTRAHAFRYNKPTEVVDEIYNSISGQQRFSPRPNVQVDQPAFRPSNPPQARPTTGYNSRRQKFQNKKLHGNQQQDLRPVGSQQTSYPQNNLNNQQKTYVNQQQDSRPTSYPQNNLNVQQKTYGNKQQDSRPTSYPQNNLNVQQPKTSNSYGNQQQDSPLVRQSQTTWNSQQKPAGFNSPYDAQTLNFLSNRNHQLSQHINSW